jgi:predicted dehydrogenase
VKQTNPSARGFRDHRELLTQKDIDIALVTTPDHWHSVIAIDALNAGKDVYVEKPLTLKIEEGPPIVKAARVNDRYVRWGCSSAPESTICRRSTSTWMPVGWAR